MDQYYKLDNPAWYALAESHSQFAVGTDRIKRYRPDIVAFAAFSSGNNNLVELTDLIGIDESVFLIGDLPELPSNFMIESTLPCAQMIIHSAITTPLTIPIETLGTKDDDEIMALINLVQPGYYKPGTRLMGDYFGIRQNGKLVAITGERMRMNGLTEVSAVVTHPDFTGRKYAQQLVTHVVNKNLAAGIVPFLHVAETNQRAIRIYEHLGFVKRRTINFTKIKRKE
jgi:GNAT superfamily N-acetyltransferase